MMEESFLTEQDKRRLDGKMHHVNLSVVGRLLFAKVRNGPNYQIIQCTISVFRFGSVWIQENPHLEMCSGTLG